jgi:transferase CAF17, mitochondrial
VLYDLFVYQHLDETNDNNLSYIIEHDSRGPTPLLDMLKKHVLRARVKLRDVSQEYDVWAAWGSDTTASWDTITRQWSVAKSGSVEPVWDATAQEWPWGVTPDLIRDRRAPGMGERLLVRKSDRREPFLCLWVKAKPVLTSIF